MEPSAEKSSEKQPVQPESATPAVMNETDGDWHVAQPEALSHDDLLRCLLIVLKHYENPMSAHALTSGLPLDHGKLTPELVTRAASRAGMASDLLPRKLVDINPRLLPTILLLKGHRACVLMEIDHKGKTATVIYPETDHGSTQLSLEDLQATYLGHAIFLCPSYTPSERSENLKAEDKKHWFWSAMRKVMPMYSEVLLASFLVNLFAIASPLFVMNVYDRVVPNQATETLWALAIGVGIVFTFDFILRTTRSYFLDMAGKRVDIELSAKVFEQVLGLRMAQRPKSVGVLANTVQSFDAFREFITSATASVLVDIPFVVIFLLVIWYLGGSLVWVPLVAIPLVLIVSLLLQIPFRGLVQESFRHGAEKQATMIESLSNVETIKTMNAQSHTQRKWEELTCAAARLGIKMRMLSGTTMSFTMFVQQMATVAIVIMGVYSIGEGLITMGALIACTILTGRALAPMAQVAGLITRYQQAMASLSAIDVLMQQETERPEGKHTLHRARFEGRIEFKEMTFTYPGQKSPALHHISFNIQPGERVALVGRVGSGKTTLQKLLVGLLEPDSGHILIDNIALPQMDPADLRHNIGYMPQDIELFYGSVKENILLGAVDVSDEQLIQASHISGVDQIVHLDPDGFDRQIGERGCQLSGGQRQAICVARALLRDPSILVLDEPTNFMDDKSESLLKQQLAHYVQSKTLLLITHRASLLDLVDRLIVLDKGQIVADGPKDLVLHALQEGKVSKPKAAS